MCYPLLLFCGISASAVAGSEAITNGFRKEKTIERSAREDDILPKRFAYVNIPKTLNNGRGELPRGLVDVQSVGADDIEMPDKTVCNKQHVPARYLQDENNVSAPSAFASSNDTLCITRHPYERAVNLYTDMLFNTDMGRPSSVLDKDRILNQRCTSEGINSYLQAVLQRILAGNKYAESCLFLPQYEFVFAPDGGRLCSNTLRHDQLPGAFNSLMQQEGYEDSLTSDDMSFGMDPICASLNTSALTVRTKRMLDKAFDADFLNLGYSKETKEMFFVHIPRNAGEAVRSVGQTWLTQLPNGFPVSEDAESRPAKGSCDRYLLPPKHMRAQDLALLNRSDSFCIVRHPYDRALSLYTYWLTHPSGVEIAEQNGLDLYENPPCSRSGLNAFLVKALTAYSSNNGSIPGQPGTLMLNCHMFPQADYIFGDDGTSMCKTILPVDHLNERFERMMTESGFDLRLTSFRSPRRSAARCPHLKRESLSEETLRIIVEVYHEDFARLGFSP